MSHNGRPNQVRTCSRWLTSERIVLSDRPAAERASTNPPNTSISNRSISSGPAAPRISRRSRTTASPTAPPLPSGLPQEQRPHRQRLRRPEVQSETGKTTQTSQRPWSRHGGSGTSLSELRGYFLETHRWKHRQ